MIPAHGPADESAVSPVVGVVLMVAIVVMVMSVVGAFVLGATPGEPAPNADFIITQIDKNGDTVLDIRYAGGEPVSEKDIKVLVNGNRALTSGDPGSPVFDGDSQLEKGEARMADKYVGGSDLAKGDIVRIVWLNSQRQATLEMFEVKQGGDLAVLDDDSSVVTDDDTVRGDGGELVSTTPSGAEVIGNTFDVDGDDTVELPFVDSSGNLKIKDSNGNVQVLPGSPDTDKSRLAAGTWDGSDPSVFYAGDSHDKLFRVKLGGSPVELADPPNGANSVVGPADVDGDGTDELVFADASQTIRYVEPSGGITKLGDGNTGSNNGIGSGSIVDIDGDGDESIITVTGSNTIELFSDAEGDRQPAQSDISTDDSTKAAKSPATAADVDKDGKNEIVYLNKNEFVRYIDDVGNAETLEFLRDKNGNKVSGDDDLGLVS